MPSIIQKSRDSDQQADVGRFALLLAIVVVIIGLLGLVGSPEASEGTGTLMRVVITILAVSVVIATIRIARISRQNQRWFASLVGVLLVVSIIGFLVTSNPLLGKVISFSWVLLVVSAPLLLLRQVLAADQVTVQTILGSITVYLLLGVALALLAIAMQDSAGFFEVEPRPTAYIYFAFVTITTLGYGDLAPFTDAARMVSVMAAVIAQMYLVIVVARLVSIWRPARNTNDPGEDR
jgi:hypothetical protein